QAAGTLRERRERVCVVHGFLGLLAERDGDPARATAHYRRCAAVRLVMWAQHHWAVNRLAALGGR
ncbi:MAG: hypothetical protein KIT58_24915, partial [Planctomycetota bacterium]|nr:hypothetical protein [Planctomycetota bacterium]